VYGYHSVGVVVVDRIPLGLHQFEQKLKMGSTTKKRPKKGGGIEAPQDGSKAAMQGNGKMRFQCTFRGGKLCRLGGAH